MNRSTSTPTSGNRQLRYSPESSPGTEAEISRPAIERIQSPPMQALCRRPRAREWHTRHEPALPASWPFIPPPCSSPPTHHCAQSQSQRSAEPGSRSHRQLTEGAKGAATSAPGYPVSGAPAVRIRPAHQPPGAAGETNPQSRTASRPPFERPVPTQHTPFSSTRHPGNQPPSTADGRPFNTYRTAQRSLPPSPHRARIDR
jgi:hypothetical protein